MVQLITICIALFTLFATSVQGAEKPYRRASVVKSYRTCMKEKNFAQARQVLTDAIRQYPEAAADAQLYRYKMEALGELIGVENRKIYLNNKPDTLSFFNHMYELYVTGLQCDSVEQKALLEKQAEGKKAVSKFRAGVGQSLLLYRKNLFNAGKFHYTKKSYAEAFRFFDMYVRTKTANVFIDTKGNSILTDPDDIVDASVLSVLSAYGSSNYSGVMTYLSESLKDESLLPQLLEIGAKTSAELSDTLQMVRYLEQGFDAYPDVEYFFVTLVKYYNDHGDYAKSLEKVHRMTTLYPQRRDYWYMEGTELVLLNQYDEAIQAFQQCVNIKADGLLSEVCTSIRLMWRMRTLTCPSRIQPTTNRRMPSPNSIVRLAQRLSKLANLTRRTPPYGSRGFVRSISNSIEAKPFVHWNNINEVV